MGEVIFTKLHLLFIQFCKYATKSKGISHVLRSKGKKYTLMSQEENQHDEPWGESNVNAVQDRAIFITRFYY